MTYFDFVNAYLLYGIIPPIIIQIIQRLPQGYHNTGYDKYKGRHHQGNSYQDFFTGDQGKKGHFSGSFGHRNKGHDNKVCIYYNLNVLLN